VLCCAVLCCAVHYLTLVDLRLKRKSIQLARTVSENATVRYPLNRGG
jgi:hypothetical protein